MSAFQATGGVVEAESVRLPHTGVSSVVLRGDGVLAASSGWDGCVRLFDWQRFPCPLAVLQDHTDGVHCCAFAAADTAPHLGTAGVLATGGKDGRVVVRALFG
jgi:WD40 repeat protein